MHLEAILNSSSLFSLSFQPFNPTVLTPSQFLISEGLAAIPDQDVAEIPLLTLRIDRSRRCP